MNLAVHRVDISICVCRLSIDPANSGTQRGMKPTTWIQYYVDRNNVEKVSYRGPRAIHSGRLAKAGTEKPAPRPSTGWSRHVFEKRLKHYIPD